MEMGFTFEWVGGRGGFIFKSGRGRPMGGISKKTYRIGGFSKPPSPHYVKPYLLISAGVSTFSPILKVLLYQEIQIQIVF